MRTRTEAYALFDETDRTLTLDRADDVHEAADVIVTRMMDTLGFDGDCPDPAEVTFEEINEAIDWKLGFDGRGGHNGDRTRVILDAVIETLIETGLVEDDSWTVIDTSVEDEPPITSEWGTGQGDSYGPEAQP
jgi:hypothetical protein